MQRIWIFCIFLFTTTVIAQPPESLNWELVWQDEFDGEGLDPSKWTIGQEWKQNDCNYPSSTSVNGKNLVEVSEGTLKLRSWNEPSGGKTYTGALVKTRQTGSDPALFRFHYGYLETRVKRTAIGEGFHMNCYTYAYDENSLQSSSLGGHVWPSEIDYAETLSREYYRDKILNALHINKGAGNISHEHWNSGIDWSDWHTYGFHWKETGYVDFYIDGNLTFSTTEKVLPDYPHYLVLRIGVGGWIGEPDENTQFPGVQEVDWIRYYQPVRTQEIVITQPENGETFSLEDPVEFGVAVTTHSDTAKSVVYYIDGLAVDSVLSYPFSGSWKAAKEGRFTVIAGVYDSQGRLYRSDPVYITIGDIQSNLLFNPDFEEELEPWELITLNEAAAQVSLTDQDPLEGNKSLKIGMTNPTSSLSNIILRQKMHLEKDQTYTLSFLAKAESSRKMAIDIHQYTPSASYLFKLANLTTEKTKFTFSFTPSGTTYKALVDFYLGGNSSGVYIDSVYLNKFDPSGINCIRHDHLAPLIYPNPVKDILFVDFTGVPVSDLVVTDLSGRKKVHIPKEQLGNGIARIDFSDFSPGIYLLSYLDKEGWKVKKIVH